MKLYIHKETGGIYQMVDNEVWGHPVYEEDQLLDLDVQKGTEWTIVDGYGDDVLLHGEYVSQLDFSRFVQAKLTENEKEA